MALPGDQMPEILTESFCERCGTRYTFESSAPRGPRLKGLKVVSRGLKNFVMSDDTSMDEAMAAARSETDREVTSQQLDAFHKTFNFCMSCRQYTCGNCWNEAEGRCLSCAPHLGHDILPAPFPDLDAGGALTAPATNGHVLDGSNGHAAAVDEPMAWPTSDLMRDEEPGRADDLSTSGDLGPIDPLARLAGGDVFDVEDIVPEVAEATAMAEAPPDAVATGSVDAEPVDPTAAAPVDAAPPDMTLRDDSPDDPLVVDDVAAAAAARTTDLLRRFRPGQNLDEEIAAYEREQAAAAQAAAASEPMDVVTPEPVVAEPVVAEPEPVAAAPEPFLAEPEPVEIPPEPVAAAPESVVAEPVAPEPPPVRRDDVVAQPTWQVVAPDSPPAQGLPTAPPAAQPGPAPADQVTASADPQWPAQPEWPTPGSAAGLPFLGRPAAPTGGIEALWAESAREVVSAPAVPTAKTAGGVQPCVSCGLSLSANARFCRRCGSRQA
jgi:hypothetical protein